MSVQLVQKRQLLEAILEQQEVVLKDGWNVATSQRRDVGSTNIKVNNRQRSDASTSQRCDVPTSRHECEFCILIIKSKNGCRIGGIGNHMNEGAEIRVAVTSISKKRLGFVFFLCFG